jgi:RNA polymerase sigma factor (sigma-70 family)
MPPPASGLPARLVLGPALRAQSDGRLVRLVREGYESAFEEIVRRYRRPLDRFAASIVGGRSEDVTQDSFRKALVALRGEDGEIELRPWLYRIVRNTALNDLRDRPPAAAELAEELMAGGRSAAAVAEERAEVAALTARLRALPENQRAALVMRELEGMGHEEIAAALGISSGAARQAIARARTAARTGCGAFLPLPLLRALASGGDGATEAAVGAGSAIGGASGGAAAGTGGAAAGGGLGAVGGVGATGLGGALKLGLATVVVAGSVGAGVAIEHHAGAHRRPEAAKAAAASGGPRADEVRSTPSPVPGQVDDRNEPDDRSDDAVDDSRGGRGRGDEGNHRHANGHDGGDSGPSDDGQHHGSGNDADALGDNHRGAAGGSPSSGGGPGPPGGDDVSVSDHSGPGHGGDTDDGFRHGGGTSGSGSPHGDGSDSRGDDRPDGDDLGPGRDSGTSGSASSSGSDGLSGTDSGSGSDSSDSRSPGQTSGGRGSDEAPEQGVEAAPAEAIASGSSSGGPGPSSGSSGGSDGSGSSDSSGGGPGPSDDSEISP